MCDRVAVMYAGEIVEQTDVDVAVPRPLHPYTQGLIGSIPVVGDAQGGARGHPRQRAQPHRPARGLPVRAALRGPFEEDVAIATEVHPELLPVAPGHDVRCWLYHDAAGGLMPRASDGRADGPRPGRGRRRARRA